jgi:proliferating cell nuclear antigen
MENQDPPVIIKNTPTDPPSVYIVNLSIGLAYLRGKNRSLSHKKPIPAKKMVEVVFAQASVFKRLIDSLKGLVEDVSFECETSGISVQAMDVSHVSLIAMELPADIFATYSCASPSTLSFSVETLATKILRSAGANDELSIRTSGPREDIEIQVNSPNQDKSTRFRLKRVDVQSDPVAIPEHIYRARLQLNSQAMNQLVKSLSEVNDSVSVRCTEGSIAFSVADASVEATTTFNAGVGPESAEDEVEVDVTESCRVSYALRYLKAISAAAGLAPRVSLSFSPHYPLLVEYSLSEGGYVRFYLAPKVEEDDESDEL